MNFYLILAIILFLYMNLWFVVSLIHKRNDVADIAWGLGFVLVAWSSYCISGQLNVSGLVVNFLVSIWGLRLAWHIHNRNKNKAEDYRYLAWRKEWGSWFYIRSYLQVYMLQGIFLYLISLPVLFINFQISNNISLLDLIGVIVWIVGFYFESVGDAQLSDFIKNPLNKGKLLQSGLWAYTRHPNYFGEVTQWWGIWILTLNFSNGWLTILGPLTITLLILKVSGIPLLEKKMEENPEFIEYKKRVSVFIPMFPKKIV